MKDDDKPYFWMTNTPANTRSHYFEMFKNWVEEPAVLIGVDWAKDSGMNRGDVIKRDGNITHVRFRTVAE